MRVWANEGQRMWLALAVFEGIWLNALRLTAKNSSSLLIIVVDKTKTNLLQPCIFMQSGPWALNAFVISFWSEVIQKMRGSQCMPQLKEQHDERTSMPHYSGIHWLAWQRKQATHIQCLKWKGTCWISNQCLITIANICRRRLVPNVRIGPRSEVWW